MGSYSIRDDLKGEDTVQVLLQGTTMAYFPIHLASIKGHVDVVRALLQYWPDSRELLNCHGQNILHVAAKSRGHNMVSYFLQTPELEKVYKHEGQTWKHTLAFGHHGLASKDC
ncbi:unnamed protein product [Camellia sinensis]